jgi:hypothetical protein
MHIAHASGFMDRDGNICLKCGKKGPVKMQQLSWVAIIISIMSLAAGP